MGSLSHPRGRLPRRVYWVRRAVVLVVALGLVLGLARLFGGTGSDGDDSTIKASPSAAREESTTTAPPVASLGPVAPPSSSTRPSSKVEVPLAAPDGDCEDDEITVLPEVKKANGGGPITILLGLTSTRAACTFDVSPESLVVKITSGDDRIWTSQDCPKSITETEVVVRSAQPVAVPVVWSGRRSDDECTNQPAWALPGFYHVYAAAYGSAPSDLQFEVTSAATITITKTPKPRPSATAKPRTSKPSGSVSSTASPRN